MPDKIIEKQASKLPDIFIISATYAKNKWKNLCDSYKKCLDRERDINRSGSGATKPPRCRYYRQLSFLRDTLSNRTTHSNVTLSSVNKQIPSPSTSSSSEVISLNENVALNQNYNDPEPLATIASRKKKKLMLNFNSFVLLLLLRLKN